MVNVVPSTINENITRAMASIPDPILGYSSLRCKMPSVRVYDRVEMSKQLPTIENRKPIVRLLIMLFSPYVYVSNYS